MFLHFDRWKTKKKSRKLFLVSDAIGGVKRIGYREFFLIFWWSVSYRHQGSAPFFFSMKKSSSRHADILFNMESTRAFFPSSFLSHSSSPPFLLFLPLMPRPNRIECRGNRTEEDVVCVIVSHDLDTHTHWGPMETKHTHPLFPYTHTFITAAAAASFFCVCCLGDDLTAMDMQYGT